MKFEIREFRDGSFGERFEVSEGLDLGDFDDYCEAHTPIGVEPEDEQARPWGGIMAGRQWEDSGMFFSAFCYQD